jgi:hypothetical protein
MQIKRIDTILHLEINSEDTYKNITFTKEIPKYILDFISKVLEETNAL